MNRLTCEQAFARLDDYLDRELSPQEITEVEQHLAVCAVCTREFTLEHEVLDLIRTKLRRIRLPEGLRERISAALAAAGPSG